MRGIGKGEKFAEGSVKDVFFSSESPNSVVQEFKGVKDFEKTAEQIKGRFYLTKILHALLPKNIPDIEFAAKKAGSGNEVFVTEKRYRDPQHIAFNRKFHHPMEVSEGDLDLARGRINKISKDPRFNELLNKLRLFGVTHDPNEVNYSYDKADEDNPETSIQLLDNDFIPWEFLKNQNEIYIFCNFPVLLKFIQEIPDEKIRSSAIRYFDRLKALLEIERSKFPDYECEPKDRLP